MTNRAPVALFNYCRPNHSKQVLDALAENIGAAETRLYLIQDGLKLESDPKLERDHALVTQLITEFEWPGEKILVIKNENHGLANSIISGVSDLTDEYGKVIVLEDDVVPNKYFLSFMNKALEFYEEVSQVGHVSGYMFPIQTKGLPETFFYNAATCWGWGTWKRAWEHFEPNAGKLVQQLKERNLRREFNLDGAYDFFEMLEKNRDGLNDSWAIRWQASLKLMGLLSLHPRLSYTQNIGFDGSGVHCNETDQFYHERLNDRLYTPDQIHLVENSKARKRMIKYYTSGLSRWNQIKQKVRNKLIKE